MSHPTHDSHAHEADQTPLPPLRLTSAFTDGGHEVDSTPNRNLFAFLGVMAVLLIAASVFVYQLFVAHTGDQLAEAASKQAPDLGAKIARDTEALTTWGRHEAEGVVTWRMPAAEAKRRILSNPALFAPAAPPAGWVHPDDAN